MPPVPNRCETGARHCKPWPVSPVAPCSQGGHVKGGRQMDGGWLRLHPQSLWRQSLHTSTGLSVHAASEEALTAIYHSTRPHHCQDLYLHVGSHQYPLLFLDRYFDKEKEPTDVSPTLVPVRGQMVRRLRWQAPTVLDKWPHCAALDKWPHRGAKARRQGDNPLAKSSTGGDHCPQSVWISGPHAFAESPRVMLASPI